MQDPERAVGSEPDALLDGFNESGESHESSAPWTAATVPAASGMDDASKKAVDNVLYSDVCTELPMRYTFTNQEIRLESTRY